MEDKAIEDIYKKKTPIEHILDRPDTYVGSMDKETVEHLLLNETKTMFAKKTITIAPALFKIFDEIVVNAADNYQRSKNMNTIKVVISKEKGFVSVLNNGKGIPIEVHKEHRCYVPELIFGHLLTGSNYNDDEERVTGGRNGYGAKLTNILSQKFFVECGDKKRKRKFKMKWSNNMRTKEEPVIEKNYSGENFTKVTFYPDFPRFQMNDFEDDIIQLFEKRIYDLCAVLPEKVNIYLNGHRIPLKNFNDYCKMYLVKDQEGNYETELVTMKRQDRWQVSATISDGEFQQVSFVNSICTTSGGTHVNHVADQIAQKLIVEVTKKHKKMKIKPHIVKSNLFIFVNSLIVNPSFKSQTKEYLSTKISDFGSRCQIKDSFIKKLLNTGIIDQIIIQYQARMKAKMQRTMKGKKRARLTGIDKLDDANKAGTREGYKCTLIVTEGDSAKTLAMAGLETIGRDLFGVFPLRGKFLNVREASPTSIMKNHEVTSLIEIIGLQIGKEYKTNEDLKGLRYGKLMIMADQDHDGSHIKGLVINFIHHFWPSLFKLEGFLIEFVTPIVKISKNNQVIPFFTLRDFKQELENSENGLKGWRIKYYKGLGTSTDEEAQEYFQALDQHRIEFRYRDFSDDTAMELAFSKKKADARKTWLANYDPDSCVDHTQTTLRYKAFIDKELIHFSIANNARAIPSVCDGLKSGQRKILFGCFKRNLKKEIKVAQLIGYIAEHSAYHHGEMSLSSTIIGMAQKFVGSNNINLLMPKGQFGSRAMGGKDHASARYIHTCLNKITRFIFPESDDHTLDYLEDDGQMVEPKWYMPIIPMILVNGCEGIGSGWSTNIPSYNPREIIENIKRKLDGEAFKRMVPWYKGYNGIIEPKGTNFVSKGVYEVDEMQGVIDIKELPLKKWTKDYKKYVEGMLDEKKCSYPIEDFKEYHTTNRIHFRLEYDEDILGNFIDKYSDAEKYFKLSSNINISNMVAFNHEGKLRKYTNEIEIMEEFFSVRMKIYQKRKDYMMSKVERDIEILSQKINFITAVCDDEIILKRRKKKEIVSDLIKLGFKKMSLITKIRSTKVSSLGEKKTLGDEGSNSDDDEDEEEPELKKGKGKETKSGKQTAEEKEFNYLLNMNLWSLSMELVQNLLRQKEEKEDKLDILRNQSIKDIYLEDISKFETCLSGIEEKEQKLIKKKDKKIKKAPKKVVKKKKRKKRNKTELKESAASPLAKKAGKKGKNKKIKRNKKKTKPAKPKQPKKPASKALPKEFTESNIYKANKDNKDTLDTIRFRTLKQLKANDDKLNLYERLLLGELEKQGNNKKIKNSKIRDSESNIDSIKVDQYQGDSDSDDGSFFRSKRKSKRRLFAEDSD